MNKVIYTSLIEALINTEASKLWAISIPSGRFGFSLPVNTLVDSATSMVLATDCLIMPMPTMATPLPRNETRSSSTPRSILAISPSLTRKPSSPWAKTILAKSSGLLKLRSTLA